MLQIIYIPLSNVQRTTCYSFICSGLHNDPAKRATLHGETESQRENPLVSKNQVNSLREMGIGYKSPSINSTHMRIQVSFILFHSIPGGGVGCSIDCISVKNAYGNAQE